MLAILPQQIKPKVFVLFAFYINTRLIIKYRKVIPVFIFFIFSFTYVTPFYYHFFRDKVISAHQSFNNSYYLESTLVIYTLFLLSIFFFSKQIKNYIPIPQRITYIRSNTRFLVLTAIIVLIVIFGLQGDNLLNGAYGHIDKQQSPLFEYALIFIAITILYAKSSKLTLRIFVLLIFLTIFKDFLYGGRITSIQIMLLVYMMLFENKVSKIWIYIFLSLGFLAMVVFMSIRSNPEIFLSGNFTIEDFFRSKNKEYMVSNQGDVAQASARLLGLIEINILSTANRIKSFFHTFISILIPGVSISELDDLSYYFKDRYSSGGGALMPVYFFVWFSYFGVALCGFIVSRIIYIFSSTKNIYWLLFGCLAMSTFPRWLAYNPITLFKLCIYVIPIYFVFKKVIFKALTSA